MKYITAIGEALIDFIPNKKECPLKDVPSFTKACGGAPANVCAAAARLGGKARLITKLGNDPFGDFITETLSSVGVDTSFIQKTNKANTALAFVSLKSDGNRDFSFYRNPSADMLLEADSLTEAMFKDAGFLHFCSVDLIEAPVKYAHIRAIELAKSAGAVISFDPNIRLPLWKSSDECKNTVNDFIKYADVLKISDEELEFITGETEIKKAAPTLFKQGVKMLLYTMGSSGAMLITPSKEVFSKCPKVNVKDTTGAGDSITGAFLYSLSTENVTPATLQTMSESKMQEILDFSNAYSSYSVTGSGAISSYATLPQIKEFIKTIK